MYRLREMEIDDKVCEQVSVWFSFLMTQRVSPPRRRASKQRIVMSL
jgi:hypothetical protein